MTGAVQDLPQVLQDHLLWLNVESGRRADLRGAVLGGAVLREADLRGADLSEADLRWADLVCADLGGACLREADLRGADLSGACLRGAVLREADLSCADLSWADLGRACLRGADLRGADLGRADLREADLRGADLIFADLSEADLRGTVLDDATVWPDFQIPQEGPLVVWKALREGIAKLEIPAEAKRTASLVGRKCRAEFALVSWLSDDRTEAVGRRCPLTLYRVGRITRPDAYDGDPRVECARGIHFFLTEEEARAW